jgi:uncharacterized protein (TIGR02301 family)
MFEPNMLRIFAIVALLFCLAVPARAQFWGAPLAPAPWAKPPAPAPAPVPAKPLAFPSTPVQPSGPQSPPAREEAAPYDPDLQRLSEILGALHFLRGICDNSEGQKWRNEAQSLIEAEAPAGERHDKMIASFNRGYRGFQQSYRSCTPSANLAIRRYLEEGAKIARDITARYAN